MAKSEVAKSNGFIFLHRAIMQHWIWEDPIKLKWWLLILMECNHTDQRVSIGYELLDCKRGQSLNSLLTWSKIFRVDKSSVRRFFKLLENDFMIVTENVQKTTRLTVCNYDYYNSPATLKRHASDTQRNSERHSTQLGETRNATQTIMINNDNNVNNDKERESAFAPHEIEQFKKFEEWVGKKAPNVSRLKEPFTIKQFLKIKKDIPREKIFELLLEMHNWKPLLAKKTSANLTLRNWYKKDKNGKNNQGSHGGKPVLSANTGDGDFGNP